MGIVFKNNAKTTLASSLSNSATSATVTDGSVFPSLSAGEFFLITFDDGTNNEICKCTARSGNTLTIVRAQESTTARAFSSGDSAEGRVTAGVLEQIQENIAAKSANQTVFNTTTAGGATTYNIGTNPGVEANAMVFLNGVLQHHDTLSFSGTNLTFDAAPPNGMALEVIIDNLINLQSSNLTVDSFTAADVSGNPQTDFTLSDTPAAETNLIVFVDGVFQDQDAYTISSNTLTITTGVIAGRGVTVYVINPVNIGTPSDSTVTSAKLSGNITMPGNLIVGSNDVAFDSPTFVVDHTNSRVGMGIASPTVPVDIVGEVKTSSHINIGGNLVKASGDLTLDVGGDIILDADGGEIFLKDGGTTFGELSISGGSDLVVQSSIADKDILFVGTDGSSVITALTLDISESGRATFNEDLIAQGLYVGSRNGSYDFYNNGSSYFNGAVQIDDALTLSGGSAALLIGTGYRMDDNGTTNAGRLGFNRNPSDGAYLSSSSYQRFQINGPGSSGDFLDIQNYSNSGSFHGSLRMSGGNLYITGNNDRRIKLSDSGIAGVSDSNNTVHIRGDNDSLKLNAAGNGHIIFEENGTERLRISSGGNVGVGMTPTHQFSVIGTDTATAINLGQVDSSFPDTLGMFVSSTAHTQTAYGDLNIKARTDYGGYYGIGFFTASSNSTPALRFKIDSTGNLFYINAPGSTAGNPTLYVNTTTGYIYYYSSSLRYKENVQDFPSTLAKVNQLRPVTYNDKATGEASSGLIAEEVNEITPELVTYKEIDGSLQPETVLYDRLTVHLLKAMQEQQVIIDDLKARIETLEG